ncbi:hypothetical protein CTAM01_10862 [Colletotrichum tamarilloi]|uniref:Uncharacterized protein n=1 Tax=Colletotrichum tamarilloi TaxID=1209934 RepID=A0ABQ9QZA4_9PEZI|nr:uncharacterized protein CTAM01_10862 [Colletotrichum tamarilloi]KAK1490193.1 hypothetical protein CTAM01_10862 [Colletotrichum tamarilloi]
MPAGPLSHFRSKVPSVSSCAPCGLPAPACLLVPVSSSTPVERDERLLQRTNKPRRLFLLSLDLALSDPYSYSYSHSLLLSPSSQIPPASAVPISSR